MAYTVTWTLTRPDEGTALPTIASISAANKSESDTALSDAGATKGYEVDGLVTKVVYVFPDKATHDALDFSGVTDESTVRATYKQALIDANITCTIVDSEGTTIADF
tara:strand:+ start:235 stop:555 length:321 start_codon:yes stop_codon:yes gene_type:complete